MTCIARKKGRKVSFGVVLRQLLPAALCWALLASVGIVHVLARTEVVDAGYQLSSLETQNRELMLQNDRLKLELTTLKRPARLERLVREQLGMAPPEAGAVASLGAVRTPRLKDMLKGRREPVTLAERR